jgi:hypothetical protein
VTERVEFYDDDTVCDRYTAIFLDRPYTRDASNPLRDALAMDDRPFHPQGFGQHCSAMLGEHLGKPITFEDLPPDCQKFVMQEFEE